MSSEQGAGAHELPLQLRVAVELPGESWPFRYDDDLALNVDAGSGRPAVLNPASSAWVKTITRAAPGGED